MGSCRGVAKGEAGGALPQVPVITFLLSEAKLPSSPSKPLTARREKPSVKVDSETRLQYRTPGRGAPRTPGAFPVKACRA